MPFSQRPSVTKRRIKASPVSGGGHLHRRKKVWWTPSVGPGKGDAVELPTCKRERHGGVRPAA